MTRRILSSSKYKFGTTSKPTRRALGMKQVVQASFSLVVEIHRGNQVIQIHAKRIEHFLARLTLG